MDRNNRILLSCLVGVSGMLGLTFWSAELYDLFCRVTGFGGTTQVAEYAPDEVLERTMKTQFDSNVAPGVPITFRPLQRSQTARIGEPSLAFYEVTNTSKNPVTIVASYNVAPAKMGAYFAKVQCFCFEDQRLEPGQTMRMPVAYFVTPAVADDPNNDEVKTVTLSYTFYMSKNQLAQR